MARDSEILIGRTDILNLGPDIEVLPKFYQLLHSKVIKHGRTLLRYPVNDFYHMKLTNELQRRYPIKVKDGISGIERVGIGVERGS